MKPTWLDATEAIALLGVNHATLYAYVSRGHIRSEPLPGRTRRRRYSREDIERLVANTRDRRNPERVAARALHLGMPVLESGITLISNGRLYYRGQDVSELAHKRSISDVAAILWTGANANGTSLLPPRLPPHAAKLRRSSAFIAAAQAALAVGGADDPFAYDLRSQSVAQTGWRIVWRLAGLVAGTNSRRQTIDATLACAWGVEDNVNLIRAALILSADHELNVSTFTVRCVASAGTSPYGAIIAGLAALEGTKHGGTTARIEAAWDQLRGARDITGALSERLRRDERIEGFGHPLYPQGDPRAKTLLALLPSSKTSSFARSLARAVNT